MPARKQGRTTKSRLQPNTADETPAEGLVDHQAQQTLHKPAPQRHSTKGSAKQERRARTEAERGADVAIGVIYADKRHACRVAEARHSPEGGVRSEESRPVLVVQVQLKGRVPAGAAWKESSNQVGVVRTAARTAIQHHSRCLRSSTSGSPSAHGRLQLDLTSGSCLDGPAPQRTRSPPARSRRAPCGTGHPQLCAAVGRR